MSEKKKDGLKRVRNFIISTCATDGVAELTTDEIGKATGMSKQMAARHIKTLVELGVLQKLRQSVYVTAFNAPKRHEEVYGKFTGSLREVDKELIESDFAPEEVYGKFTESLRKVYGKFTDLPKRKYLIPKEEEKEKNKLEENVFGKKYFPGIKLGNGILLEGAPDVTGTVDQPTLELDRRIDWEYSEVQSIEESIKNIFNTKEKNWSPNLTKYIVAGVIYGMAGFQKRELLSQALYVRQSLVKHRQTEKLISDEKCFSFKDNKYPKHGWYLMFWYVKERFAEHGILAMPCEKTAKQKRKEAAESAKATPLFDRLKVVGGAKNEDELREECCREYEKIKHLTKLAKAGRLHERDLPLNEPRNSKGGPMLIGNILGD